MNAPLELKKGHGIIMYVDDGHLYPHILKIIHRGIPNHLSDWALIWAMLGCSGLVIDFGMGPYGAGPSINDVGNWEGSKIADGIYGWSLCSG